ncbi:hypothetical protein B1NLA3E_05930 [Bacillus sp. 1NLA3E]|nr:hypothetical protein B1NLA3E_05930 [Bacillus sp. 1NLA3E]
MLICLLLIGAEGAKTPAGAAGQVRSRRSFSDEEAHARPAESEATGAQINRSVSIDNLKIDI